MVRSIPNRAYLLAVFRLFQFLDVDFALHPFHVLFVQICVFISPRLCRRSLGLRLESLVIRYSRNDCHSARIEIVSGNFCRRFCGRLPDEEGNDSSEEVSRESEIE